MCNHHVNTPGAFAVTGRKAQSAKKKKSECPDTHIPSWEWRGWLSSHSVNTCPLCSLPSAMFLLILMLSVPEVAVSSGPKYSTKELSTNPKHKKARVNLTEKILICMLHALHSGDSYSPADRSSMLMTQQYLFNTVSLDRDTQNELRLVTRACGNLVCVSLRICYFRICSDFVEQNHGENKN